MSESHQNESKLAEMICFRRQYPISNVLNSFKIKHVNMLTANVDFFTMLASIAAVAYRAKALC